LVYEIIDFRGSETITRAAAETSESFTCNIPDVGVRVHDESLILK
jgi:hypothetical protein